jgi:hypothetical protein
MVLSWLTYWSHSFDATLSKRPQRLAHDVGDSKSNARLSHLSNVFQRESAPCCLRIHPFLPYNVDLNRRNADLENEIASLRQRLATTTDHEISEGLEEAALGPASVTESAMLNHASTSSRSIEPHALATPLTLLTEASAVSVDGTPWSLEDVSLSGSKVAALFELYASLPAHLSQPAFNDLTDFSGVITHFFRS